MSLWHEIDRRIRMKPPPEPRREMTVVDDDWARLDIYHEDGRHFGYLIRRAHAERTP